jgi:hypothetical protein
LRRARRTLIRFVLAGGFDPVTVGAYLLRVAEEFDALEAAGTPSGDALDIMLRRTGSYDAVVLRAFEAVRSVHGSRDQIRETIWKT